jgi:hypothetical protein
MYSSEKPRRSQRLLDKQQRLVVDNTPSASAQKLSLVLPVESDLKEIVAFHDLDLALPVGNNVLDVKKRVQRRNGKTLYSAPKEVGGPVDFIVYGLLKYEIGDKKANLAKKRTGLFLTLTALFVVIRSLLFITGVIKCNKH